MKEELLKRVGSMQQIAYARQVNYLEGRASNLRAVQVKNDRLSFVALADKCLDISELSYKGLQINFLSKPGLNGRNPFDTNGLEAQRSIMGGLFFTCGYENICGPYETAEGRTYPMHGRMRTTPAEHLVSDAYWDGEDYLIKISGEMREAELFGENLLLRREITTKLGEKSIYLTDCVTNEGFRTEPLLLMYHINCGYPFLDAKSEIIIPTKNIKMRENETAENLARYNIFQDPVDNLPEQVFMHDLHADAESGQTFVAVLNHREKIGFLVRFNQKQLPYFMQWKSLASGDYVLGLEPANLLVYGRRYHEERGDLPVIEAQTTQEFNLEFEILDGESDFASIRAEFKDLQECNMM